MNAIIFPNGAADWPAGWGRIVPLLDFELLARRPRVLCGSSGATSVLLAAHARTGLVTFYGPMVGDEWSEGQAMWGYTRDHFLRAVSPEPVGRLEPSREWTADLWVPERGVRTRTMRPNPGWRWIVPGRGEGPLLGGVLTTVAAMAADGWLPPTEGAVLFWEDVFLDAEGPAALEAALRRLAESGALDHLAGMMVGRFHPQFCPADFDVAELPRRLLPPTCPVVADMDFGHTNPAFTLPLVVRVRLDSRGGTVEILEAATVTP